jgi:hypothetical protein
MPARFLTGAELAQLPGFPAGIAGEELVTYFSLEYGRHGAARSHESGWRLRPAL